MLVDREGDNSELIPEVVITIKTHHRQPDHIPSQRLTNLLNCNKVFKHVISLLSLSLFFSCLVVAVVLVVLVVCVNATKFQSKCKSESQCDG